MQRRQFLRAIGLTPIFYSGPLSLLSDSHSDFRAIISQARRAWLEGDGQAFAALFWDEGEFIFPGQVCRGPEAILEAFQAYITTHEVNTIELRNLVVQGNRALLEWYWEDTDLSTGQTSRAEDAIAIDLRGGRIQRWREYIDAVSLTRL